VLRRGTERVWHFAHHHQHSTTCTGGGESAIHRAAKRLLQLHLPHWKFQQHCATCATSLAPSVPPVAFAALGVRAVEEATWRTYRLDVGVFASSSSGPRRLVAALEVRHTHACEPAKVQALDDAGVPLLEVTAEAVLAAYQGTGGHVDRLGLAPLAYVVANFDCRRCIAERFGVCVVCGRRELRSQLVAVPHARPAAQAHRACLRACTACGKLRRPADLKPAHRPDIAQCRPCRRKNMRPCGVCGQWQYDARRWIEDRRGQVVCVERCLPTRRRCADCMAVLDPETDGRGSDRCIDCAPAAAKRKRLADDLEALGRELDNIPTALFQPLTDGGVAAGNSHAMPFQFKRRRLS